MKIHCENISCHSVLCLFHSLNSIFHRASILLLMKYFIFYGLCFDVMTKIILSNTWSWRFFFSKRFIVLDFTLEHTVHFVIFLKFLYKVWNLGQDSVLYIYIHIQLSLNHLLIRLSFLHWIVIAPLPKKSDFPTFSYPHLGSVSSIILLMIFFNFFLNFIILYNTVLVLPYIDLNPPRVYMRSQTWTPLPPTSP